MQICFHAVIIRHGIVRGAKNCGYDIEDAFRFLMQACTRVTDVPHIIPSTSLEIHTPEYYKERANETTNVWQRLMDSGKRY